MVLYMHMVIFCICLNFGLGIAHIPDTPLTIPDAVTTLNAECTNSLQVQGLLTRVVATDGTVSYVPSVDGSGNNLIFDFEGGAGSMNNQTSTGGFDAILEPFEDAQYAIEGFKNIILGGYVINVIDSITLTCDVNPDSATYGESTDSEVMTYIKAGLHIIFGLMIFLAVLYLVTGKTFGF
jgi:hypothetical protein